MNPNREEESFPPFALDNAEDHAILMHRDAHFAGQFELMLSYYEEGGKGIHPDFELARIRQLALIEMQMQKNLADVMLDESEVALVQRAKKAYLDLRQLYELSTPKSRHPQLIADLILAEEEDPKAEIEAIVAEQGSIVSALLELLRSEKFSDPLFPGYGLAPTLAARCLGIIGDKRAIISLFEGIGELNLFSEEHLLKALKSIGEPAKIFLLKVLKARPLNVDNERAAIALLHFKEDPEVSAVALKMLSEKEVAADLLLATHLALICEGLTAQGDREKLKSMATDSSLPKELKWDLLNICHSWEM